MKWPTDFYYKRVTEIQRQAKIALTKLEVGCMPEAEWKDIKKKEWGENALSNAAEEHLFHESNS
jgi:hypothetical protein